MNYGVKAINAVTAFVLWLCVVLIVAIFIMAAQGAVRAYGQVLPPDGPVVGTATPAPVASTPTPERWGDYDVYLPVGWNGANPTRTPRGQ